MIEQWQPAPVATDSKPDQALLARLATGASDFAEHNHQPLAEAELLRVQSWLKLSETDWGSSLTTLDEQQLYALAVFFTVAEQKLSGWQCGSRNPAIWCCRLLKQQGKAPAKEQIRYLKGLTDNRYIPWGKVI